MRYVKPLIAVIFIVAASAALACKCIEFKNPTAFMATPTMGAALVTFVSDKDDTLTSLTSPCCDAVELHQSSMKDGVMSMRKLDSLPLKAGMAVTLSQHGGDMDSMHIMLIGVHHPVKPGAKFPITFHFAKEEPHTAMFIVQARGVKPAQSMDEPMQMHHHE